MSSTSTPSDASIHDRLARLEARIDDLEAENETLREMLATRTDRIDTQRERIDDLEADLEAARGRLDAVCEAALKKAGANKARIAELQTRELEKGAHLRAEHVDPDAPSEGIDRLERFAKDGGTDDGGARYVRLPDADDPWQKGCETVREYVKASDMKHRIRRPQRSTNRLAIRRQTERKNGLSYTERRVVLKADASGPDETSGRSGPPETLKRGSWSGMLVAVNTKSSRDRRRPRSDCRE